MSCHVSLSCLLVRVSFNFEEALESLNLDVEYLSNYSAAVWQKGSPVLKELEQRRTLAEQAVEKAVIVKHEHFLCLTLADPESAKYQDRLRQFTADLSHVLKRPWVSGVWPLLAADVQEAMEGRAAPATSAASAGAAPAAPSTPASASAGKKEKKDKKEKGNKKDKKDKKDKKEKKEKKKKGKSAAGSDSD